MPTLVLFLSSSVWQLLACWQSLGSYPGLQICCSLQVYVEVQPSDSQLVEKGMKALPYIESATTHSDDEQIIRKCRFNNLSSATFRVLITIGKLCWT